MHELAVASGIICLIRVFCHSGGTGQVSTSTGVISHFVNLQVVVPEAFILGSGELHVDMGSTINLVCIIEKVSAFTDGTEAMGCVTQKDIYIIWSVAKEKSFILDFCAIHLIHH